MSGTTGAELPGTLQVPSIHLYWKSWRVLRNPNGSQIKFGDWRPRAPGQRGNSLDFPWNSRPVATTVPKYFLGYPMIDERWKSKQLMTRARGSLHTEHMRYHIKDQLDTAIRDLSPWRKKETLCSCPARDQPYPAKCFRLCCLLFFHV